MAKKQTKSAKKVKAAFHEVKHNPPSIVKRTAKKFGSERARKQATAIALNKARKKGARV